MKELALPFLVGMCLGSLIVFFISWAFDLEFWLYRRRAMKRLFTRWDEILEDKS